MQLGHRFWKKSAGKDLLAIIIGSSSASCDLSRGGRSSIERQRNVSRTSSFGIGEGNAVEHSEAWMEVWPLLSWTLEHRPTPRCLLQNTWSLTTFFSQAGHLVHWLRFSLIWICCLFRENGVTWEFKHQQTNYGNNNLTTRDQALISSIYFIFPLPWSCFPYAKGLLSLVCRVNRRSHWLDMATFPERLLVDWKPLRFSAPKKRLQKKARNFSETSCLFQRVASLKSRAVARGNQTITNSGPNDLHT